MYIDPKLWSLTELHDGLDGVKAAIQKIMITTQYSVENTTFQKQKVAELEDLLHAYQTAISEKNGEPDRSITSPFFVD